MTSNNHKAPYAPLASVLPVIERMRSRGLPETLDANSLQTIGVTESMAPRTLVTLKFLGLVGEDGGRTSLFERIRRAGSDEYPKVLEEILRAAYAPVFTLIDPAVDGDLKIHDAFRQYEPAAQRPKMVALFLGLCHEAGIVGPERVRSTTPKSPVNGVRKRAPRTDTPAGARTSSRGTPTDGTQPPAGVLFGLTVDDAAHLSDDEFNTVWSALGIAARARARSAAQRAQQGDEEGQDDEA